MTFYFVGISAEMKDELKEIVKEELSEHVNKNLRPTTPGKGEQCIYFVLMATLSGHASQLMRRMYYQLVIICTKIPPTLIAMTQLRF